MNHLSKIFLAGVAALSLAGAARAGTYELSFTGTNVSGDVFATTAGSGAQQTVIGISGWVLDSEVGVGPFSITGLSGYAGASNDYYLASPYVDFGGLSFSTATGGDFNIGLGGDSASGLLLNAGAINGGGYAHVAGSTDIELTATAVPEPTNLALLLAGVMGLAAVARRRSTR